MSALILFPILLFPIAVGRYISAHRRLAASVAERDARAGFERELAASRAVHGKRERIAQEMHDSLGHVLALVAVQAAALGGDRKIRVAVVDDDGDREDPSDKVVHETR